MPGAKNPLHENKVCYGFDLIKAHQRRRYEINLNYLIQARDLLGDSIRFIDQPSFFNRLAGNNKLVDQIQAGFSAQEIRRTWEPELEAFKKIRMKYLLYN
jgi:uncharacterized protein YbbC (DUF1343 family)